MAIGLLAAVVFLAFLAEATVGFGATVVTVALGAFLYPLDVLLPAFVPVNIGLSGYLVVRYRREVEWRLLLRRVLPLMGLALPIGLLLFDVVDDRPLTVGFGAFVVVLSSLELIRVLRRPGEDRPLNATARVLLLLFGGLVHGLFATGGPMAVYVAGRELTDKGAFRATLAALWLLLNLLLVAGYAIGDKLDAVTGRMSLILIAPLILGMLAGEWLHRKIRPALFRGLLFGLLLLAGLLLALGS